MPDSADGPRGPGPRPARSPGGRGRAHDREILRLAWPAFLALVSEPLFLLADAAVVGHLGTPELAGLGVAGALLQTAVGLCVFLAYGTTAAVARGIGAGRRAEAVAGGVDGLWLAVVVGLVVTAVGAGLPEPLVALFGPTDAVAEQAVTYLRIGAFGAVPLLLLLAATGVLRGLQDTRTPLVVAVAGNAANVVLNVALVYGVGLGIAGSALGSVLAQVGSAAALVLVVVRVARREGATLRPRADGVRRAGRAGAPLLLRTLTLRASLLVTVWVATDLGEAPLATHQLASTVWTFLAFALDAIAIAAQAITGRVLGAGDGVAARGVTRRMVWWGLVSGVATGLLLAATAPLLGPLFTADAAVRSQLVPVLLVAALFQPVAGVVFVLDGVLIGAGDGRYLAVAGLVVLAVFAPLALLTLRLPRDGFAGGLVWTWLVFGVAFIGGRCVVLLARARGERWMRLGSPT